MNYRTINDLSNLVRNNIYIIPKDLFAIVGIPRSGMLLAYIIGLNLNLNIMTYQDLIDEKTPIHGITRSVRIVDGNFKKKILVCDDSIDSGLTMSNILKKLDSLLENYEILTLAAFVTSKSKKLVDYYYEVVNHPRTFEWAYLHRNLTQNYCFDIDGVLCLDPKESDNDDGLMYKNFLLNAQPLNIPSYKIGTIVSNRLEKYRSETEEWLKIHKITYERLVLLDLPDMQTRKILKPYGYFKAEIYKNDKNKILFVESSDFEAKIIAKISGKPCLSIESNVLFKPGFVMDFKHKTLYPFSSPFEYVKHYLDYRYIPRRIVKLKNIVKSKIRKLFASQ